MFAAWFLYLNRPDLSREIRDRFGLVYTILDRKYGFDEFNQRVFAGGSRAIGKFLWKVGDVTLIDGLLVNGSAKTVGWISSVVRHIQTGLLYQYAFAMILGLLGLLTWFVFRAGVGA